MKTLEIYQVDAFTNQLFQGNPAAIIPLKEWLSDEILQQIALENNLSETAYFINEGNHFLLRWFTPYLEIDLCGHATLATAHVLFNHLGYKKQQIVFKTLKAGDLIVTKENELITLDFPVRELYACETNELLVKALGEFEPLEILKSRDYIVVYPDERIISQLTPDFKALALLDTTGVICTSSSKNKYDFVSRCFYPGAGIEEDPVTGSAHCDLIPYWAKKLNKQKLLALQGGIRKGELICELKNDRVLMSGNAVTYLKGEIYI